MRVAYLTSTYPGYTGCGCGIYAGALIPNLAAAGVHVEVLTSDLPEIEAGAGIHKQMHSWQFQELGRVDRFIRQVRPDILHLNHPTRIAAGRSKFLVNLLPVWNRLRWRLPFVTTIHEFATVTTLGRVKQWPILQFSDVLFVTTRRARRALESWPWLRPRRVEVVEVGAIIRPSILEEPVPDRDVLLERWGLKPTDKVVGFAGFLTRPKGFHHLIEVVAPLMRQDPNLHVLALSSWNFTGADDRQQLEGRIAELGVADRFHFTGFLENDDLWRQLGAFDVCSFPCESPIESRSSGPLRLSLLRGIPTQTYASSLGYDEFGCVHGENIWLSPFADLDRFRIDLQYLLDHSEVRQRLSRGTLSMQSELRMDHIAARHREIYSSLARSTV